MNNTRYEITFENGGSMVECFECMQYAKDFLSGYMCHPVYGNLTITKIVYTNIRLQDMLF